MPHLVFVAFIAGVACVLADAAAAEFAPLRERFTSTAAPLPAETPDFQRHVVPLFSRLGCNGRTCHGSFQGQGGFRLSMFGYDFTADLAALKSNESPRVDVRHPADSLILTKPVSDDKHGGGKRYEVGEWEYRVLRKWIEAGAKGTAEAVKLISLDVTPKEIQFSALKSSAQLRVVARWSDGTQEDVTCITRYSSNDDGTATIDRDGRVASTGKGSTYVIACYDSAVASIPVMLPVSDRVGPKYPPVPTPTKVDELVVNKLRKLGIVPADLCTDAEFLRRASLDVCGTLPSPGEIEAFLTDAASDKRARKIDELLERPEYSVWWATIFCDWTGLNAPAELGGTDYARPFGEQWFDWFERRLRDNTSYADTARGIILAVSRKPGQSYDDYVMEQVSYQRTKDRVDFAAQSSMPHFWSRGNLNNGEERALAFAHIFMGVRLDCAQCHKHPFDQWSQQDFRDFSAFFDRIGRTIHPDVAADRKRLEDALGVKNMKNAAERRGTFLRLAAQGKPTPFYEVSILPEPVAKKGSPPAKPRILGGEPIELKPGQDPREPIMDWLLEKDNPYFAPALVNRVCAHYLGIGIVDPPDDFNLGNPPSNRGLLSYLSQNFIEQGYDLKQLQREILNSRTYQQSWRSNATNRQDDRLFSKAKLRRLPAEVTIDAIRQATAGPVVAKSVKSSKQAPSALATRFIAQQAPAYESRMDYSMLVFGKPIRKTNCDCERQTDPSLLQSVYLRNDGDVRAAIYRADGWLKNLPQNAEPTKLIREAYLRVVSRPPTEAETLRCLRYFDETPSTMEALGDIVWALLNTQEFILNH